MCRRTFLTWRAARGGRLTDQSCVLLSCVSGVLSFPRWKQGTAFDFTLMYSGGEPLVRTAAKQRFDGGLSFRLRYAHKYYSGRRMWRGLQMAKPSLSLPTSYEDRWRCPLVGRAFAEPVQSEPINIDEVHEHPTQAPRTPQAPHPENLNHSQRTSGTSPCILGRSRPMPKSPITISCPGTETGVGPSSSGALAVITVRRLHACGLLESWWEG